MDLLKTTQAVTTKSVEEKTNDCLTQLNKNCILSVKKCSLTLNETQIIPIKCDFSYYFDLANKKNDFNLINSLEKHPECENLFLNNKNVTNIDNLNCFATSIYEKILNEQEQTRYCLVNEASILGFYNCSSIMKCEFENSTMAEDCRNQFQTTTLAPTTTLITTLTAPITTTTLLVFKKK